DSPEGTADHRTVACESFALHDAQFVLARSYGFESWPKLKAAVDGVTAARLHEAVESGHLSMPQAPVKQEVFRGLKIDAPTTCRCCLAPSVAARGVTFGWFNRRVKSR